MAFVFLLVGLVLVVSAARDTQDQLSTLVKGDFTTTTGKPGFLYWILAVMAVGAVGYIPKLEKFSNAALALVVLALFLNKNNRGFFSQFQQQLAAGTQPQAAATPSTLGSTDSGTATSNGTGNSFNSIIPQLPILNGLTGLN